jgi:hypothetical protein
VQLASEAAVARFALKPLALQDTLSFGPRLRAMPVSALWEVPPPA